MPPTTSSASAKAWWISPSCCCARTSCSRATSTLREHYRARFSHILVDEFQDTNRLQYRWLKCWRRVGRRGGARRGSAIFAVGDDDQSIYAFRGASAANMQDLQRDFAIERVIKLEQNYRSHGHILDAANALIGHNRRRLGKNLWTAEAKGEPLRVYEAGTDLEEAGFIVEEVKALAAEGVALDQIAVLYRSNAQSRVLEHALFTAAMPYRVYGGLRFFERQEIKHALAYLRLVANRDDDGALLRIINFPARGIGAARSSSCRKRCESAAGASGRQQRTGQRAEGRGQRERRRTNRSSLIPRPSSLAGKGIPAFVALIERMRSCDRRAAVAGSDRARDRGERLARALKAEKEGADRLENLAELINAAATFVAERDVQPAGETPGTDEPDELTAFLAHAALEAGEHQAGAGADALQLMTVHSAKGLEFHSVFMSGLEEGLFPHENSLTEADGIEEERRLMYVALTRARRRLYLTFAQSRMLHGQTRYSIASRFFHEIPDALMKRVNFSHGSRVTSHGSQGSGYGSRVTGHGSAVNDSRLATRDSQTDLLGESGRASSTPSSAPG